MDQKKYFVALSTHPRLGARTIGKMHKRFKDLFAKKPKHQVRRELFPKLIP